ncbi:flavodoxin family protein [Natroniella sulfidigena]|uniref:flavodoxin family protein n=1 Tax=Natroniella sulfidigena TaxID=723921 RepID=UPI00200A5E5E|nr:flavodoxin family protein [Natroniella sulfidigena]MCK8817939.1 flavodoxin family protein [Natroniella sulfidigena]
MKVLGISGSPVKRGTHYLLEEALQAANNQGVETDIIHLADYNLEDCQGCNHCLQKKECILEDDLEELSQNVIEADGLLIASPSYFGTVTAILKNFMDRSRCLKMDAHTLKNTLLGALATSGLNHGGAQSTIETIHRFGLLHGMIIVGPTGQAQTESNLVIGTAEIEDGWRQIKDDHKAINLAKNLGQRLVLLGNEILN